MKKFFSLMLSLVLVLGFSYQGKGMEYEAEASELYKLSNNRSVLNDYSLDFSVVGTFIKPYWGVFKFLDMGDGTVTLRPTSNGQITDPGSIKNNITITTDFTFIFRDENNNIYYQEKFYRDHKVKDMADKIANIKMRYGKDSVQVMVEEGKYLSFKIGGAVKNNLDNINFSEFPKDLAEKYSFIPKQDGLYSYYFDQNKIEDGTYTINSLSNKLLSTTTSVGNVSVENLDSNINQKWYLEYNDYLKAYKIIPVGFSGSTLSWDSNRGSNVIVYPDNNYNDQYWYLKHQGNNQYSVISANNVYKRLNIDGNGWNINVDDNRETDQQKFIFTKVY